ncbi:MAG: 7-cyano-7-deazaguanine synthase [Planctomycetota bacterium]|jgi:7-cyano-7-deazaguanine synthase
MTETQGKKKALLMLSGGLDSTVASYLAADEYDICLALTFDYGQRARRRELAASYGIASGMGVEHRTVFLPFFREFSTGALTDVGQSLPKPDMAQLDDPSAAKENAQNVWVPNRNGIFIAIASAWAEMLKADVLVVGFNAEEARTFPDNSADFVARQNEALKYSTANGVEVISPTLTWTKAEIVSAAKERDLPLELAWSCYDGGDRVCEECESCKRFDRALDEADARSWFEDRLMRHRQ